MIIFFIIACLLISVAFYAIETGKKRSYIIQRDASGRPISLIEEKRDALYPAEIHSFVGDFINEFYTQDFGSLLEEKSKAEKMSRIEKYFNAGFYKNFVFEIDEKFLRSITVRRLVSRVGFYNIRTIRIEGSRATVLYEANINLYKAGIEVGQLDRYEMQNKVVEITISRGERYQNNLYGLYITSFLDVK